MEFLIKWCTDQIAKLWAAINDLRRAIAAIETLLANLQSGYITFANGVYSVQTTAAARALPIIPNIITVTIWGQTAKYDGGQAVFVWDATSTAADDDYGILQVTANGADPGRLIKLFP